MSRRFISIVLLISILTMSIGVAFPSPVQAVTAGQVGSIIAQGGGCVGSGILSGFLSGLIRNGLKILQEKIKKITSDFVKNLLGTFLNGILGAAVPTNSQNASLLAYFQNKEYRDMVVARCLARLQLDNISNNIANIVQTRGLDGGKAIVENWRTFQTNAQYRGENVFRAMLSTANLCPSFANDLKKSYGLKPTDKIALPGVNTRVGSTQPFSVQINCTLPKDFTTQKYQQNFAALGGWNTYALMAQPQNNLYGATLLAQGQMAVQRSLEESADLAQVQANSGYTGISGKDKNDSCKIKGPDQACIIYKNIKTTGEYLAQNVAANVGAQFAWLTTAQGLNTIIEDVTQMMINKMFDQSDTSGGKLAGEEDPGVGTIVIPGLPPGGGGPGPITPGQPPTADTSTVSPGPDHCTFNLLGIIDNALAFLPEIFPPANELSANTRNQMLDTAKYHLTQWPYREPSAEVQGHLSAAVVGIDRTKTLSLNIASGVTLAEINTSLAEARGEVTSAYKSCTGNDWAPAP